MFTNGCLGLIHRAAWSAGLTSVANIVASKVQPIKLPPTSLEIVSHAMEQLQPRGPLPELKNLPYIISPIEVELRPRVNHQDALEKNLQEQLVKNNKWNEK